MPSLFVNRWGIKVGDGSGEEVESNVHSQHHIDGDAPDVKEQRKNSRRDKKRKRDAAVGGEEFAKEPIMDVDVDAAVLNYVAPEVHDRRAAGAASATTTGENSDIMFGLSSNYANDQHQWQTYINEEPTHEEFSGQQPQHQQQQQQHQQPQPQSQSQSQPQHHHHQQQQRQQQQQQKQEPQQQPIAAPASTPLKVTQSTVEAEKVKKSRKKRKTTKNVNVDPALESMDRTREASAKEQSLIREAMREASEIARSLASDGQNGISSGARAEELGNDVSQGEDNDMGSASTVAAETSEPHHQPAAPSHASRSGSKRDGNTATTTTNNNNVSNDIRQSLEDAVRRPSSADKRASWTGDGSEMGGSFTTKEKEDLDKFMTHYMIMNHLSKEGLRARVWASERRKDNFWDQVSQVLPNRTRASVYKHVRRAYHVFHARGKWTEKEDIELNKLFQEKGAQWKQIGSAMGRMPEDCRDRWRNYVKCGRNRQQNKWSTAEEAKLRQIVVEMIDSDPSGEMNWTAVSEKMDGQRSRIQCRYKWNKISKKVLPHKVDSMLQGDHVAVLDYLKNSGATDERSVDWQQLAQLEGRDFWTADDFHEAFRRLRSRQDKANEPKSFLEIVDDVLKQFKSLPDYDKLARYKPSGPTAETPLPVQPTTTLASATPRSMKAVMNSPATTASPAIRKINAGKDRRDSAYVESWKLKN